MAATERARYEAGPKPNSTPTSAPLQAPAPRAEVTKLAALHREAEETAHLANLLGRVPYAAGILTVATLLAAAPALTSMPMSQIAGWLILMMIGLGAIARSYLQAIRAPFERAPLHAFAQDLAAILTYAGFAWGAGAFLVLPASAGPLAAIAFAAVPPALVAASLRTRETALLFLGPATALSAFSMVLRPLPDGVLAAAFTLLAAAAVAGAALWIDRAQSRGRSFPRLAELPFG